MPEPVNLETVIEDSLTDAAFPDEPTDDSTPEQDLAPAEPVEAAPEGAEAPTEASLEVSSPATRPDGTKPPVEDEFSKKFGIPAESHPGRENRIPYGRVKKITEKAVNEKKTELEALYTPKLQEYEAKVKDYESRLTQVGEFESILANEPDKFLQMLSTVPAYAPFFQAIQGLAAQVQAQGVPQTQVQSTPEDPMPEPDETLTDGTKIYSLEGIKNLLAWNARSVETKVTKQYEDKFKTFEDRYKPIESEWQSHEYMKRLVPQVQAQINDARTWPLFTENEADIVKVLQANPKIDLRGAYQQVVWPKMTADRNKIREEVLAEIRKAPVSTAVPNRTTRPSTPDGTSGAPRTLEEVIAAQVAKIR